MRRLSHVSGKWVARRAKTEEYQKYRQLHTTQTATSHLFLGAIAAAKLDHGVALRHFQDALESTRTTWKRWSTRVSNCSSLVTLKLPSNIFRTCVRGLSSLRTRGKRCAHFAIVHWRIRAMPSRSGKMRAGCLAAERLVPKVIDPLDAAFTLECLGPVRKQLRGYRRAKDSFADALVRYSASNEPEAAEGGARVQKQLRK